MTETRKKPFISRVFAVCASFGTVCTLLILFIIVIFTGTLAQKNTGLYEVQQTIFNSFYFTYSIGDSFHIPFPGGYLLSICLVINLISGGLIRIRKGWGQTGILIAHSGIIMLLLSAVFLTAMIKIISRNEWWNKTEEDGTNI